MTDKLKAHLKAGNQTTVANTTIGGAIAIVLVTLANRFGADLDAMSASMLVGGFTVIFNYFIPARK